MKDIAKWAIFVVLLYVIQISFLPLISFHGVSADLLLLLTVSFGFLRGAKLGLFMGFFVGLLQDLASGTFFGVNVLIRMIIGFVSGQLSDRVFKEQFFLPVFASLAAVAANYFLTALFIFLLGYRFDILAHIGYTFVPMICWQLLLAYPIHVLTYWVNEKIHDTDNN